MFTGIIEEIGKVKQTSVSGGNLLLAVEALRVSDGLKVGDSVNINGACQTVIETKPGHLVVEAVQETQKRTNLGQLRIGDSVNLERAMRSTDRLGGHLVTGHVDFVGRIRSMIGKGDSHVFEFTFPEEYRMHFVEKGSVAVDGISLTVVEVTKDSFTVSVIPFTMKTTTLGIKQVDDSVNVETDLIGKYVGRILNRREQQSKITEEWLREKGW
jgi:riboflavin synthase